MFQSDVNMRVFQNTLILALHAALFFSGCAPVKKPEAEVLPSAEASAESSADPAATAEETAQPGTFLQYRTEELPVETESKYIYGHAFIPDSGKDSYPTVIICHGIGNDHSHTDYIGMMLAERGIAAYTFDFCGGGENSESSGDFLQMSVRTEADDLMDVTDYVRTLDFVDRNNLFLLGQSQGGYVVTEIAHMRQEDLRGIILMFPAFNINDLTAERYSAPEEVPETGVIFDQTVGRSYFLDAMAEDIEADMRAYNGHVLLLHGSEDDIVPITYSKRASELFPDAQLITIEQASHGFFGEHAETAVNACVSFIHEHSFLNP